jgi:hypothetical protein
MTIAARNSAIEFQRGGRSAGGASSAKNQYHSGACRLRPQFMSSCHAPSFSLCN